MCDLDEIGSVLRARNVRGALSVHEGARDTTLGAVARWTWANDEYERGQAASRLPNGAQPGIWVSVRAQAGSPPQTRRMLEGANKQHPFPSHQHAVVLVDCGRSS